MNAELVGRLARLEPQGASGIAQGAGAILQIHSNPAFGWHIARTFARAKALFPVAVSGRDHWLFQAYLLHLNPTGRFAPSVLEAHQLSQQPGKSATLKAMLLAGLGEPVDAHLNLVAEKTGVSRRTVEAFEVLFFNVLDRHEDGLYLSEVVYPEGRQVEFAEDYFESAPISDLLLRAAYNHRDVDLVAHLSGLDDASFVAALGKLKDREAELEKQFMGNALVMVKSGALNQRSTGMQRATALLAASRSARNQTETGACPTDYDLSAKLAAALTAVPPISDADCQEARAASRAGRSYWSDDAGTIHAFDCDDGRVDNPSPSVTPAAPMVWFPEPVSAVWRNKDFDVPVILVARMSEPGLPDHYLTDDKSGIPASEVVFEN